MLLKKVHIFVCIEWKCIILSKQKIDKQINNESTLLLLLLKKEKKRLNESSCAWNGWGLGPGKFVFLAYLSLSAYQDTVR